MYVIGPIAIHQTQWTAMNPAYKPFDPQGPGSPPEVSSYFEEIDGELDRLGFDFERAYTSTKASPNAVSFIALFVNRRTLEVAKMIGAVGVADSPVGQIRNANSLLVYATEFSDETKVVTSNTRSPRIFPKRKPPYHGFAFPQLRDPSRLLAAHRALVARFEGGKVRLDPVGDDPDGYLRDREWRAPQAHHVESGYQYRDEAAEVLRYTWKGAFLVTWKLLVPIKQIQLAARKFRAAALLGELEAEGMAR